MEIKRDSYLEQLISYRFDGLVKVIQKCFPVIFLLNLEDEVMK